MTAKPTGSTPKVNAAFVPREVRVLDRERSAPRAVQLDDDITRARAHRDTKNRAPWRAARCVSASSGSNVNQAYSATHSNVERDDAEVSSGHK